MRLPWTGKGGQPQQPGAPAKADEPAPVAPAPQEAEMEAKVTSPGVRKPGRWTIEQLRQTDGIIPLQNGTNKYASQKKMTGFGAPRNNTTRIKSENLQLIPEDIVLKGHAEVRQQSGTNRYDSQRGMTGFGSGRDVCRESDKVNKAPADVKDIEEEKILAGHGIVRLQSGTNRYASQRGMTGIGTSRRETTKMLDTKHPEYSHEKPDQSINPLQMGTNKFASQKGMTGMGTSRRETTKMLDTKHPEKDIEHPDESVIRLQAGSNQFASQRGMKSFGASRMETAPYRISLQNPDSHAEVRGQAGSNQYASQVGMVGFGTGRDVKKTSEFVGGIPLTMEDEYRCNEIIRSQSGWNQGDSQKKMTGFGTSRDVKGKHMKRIWEIEFPEEAEAPEINRI